MPSLRCATKQIMPQNSCTCCLNILVHLIVNVTRQSERRDISETLYKVATADSMSTLSSCILSNLATSNLATSQIGSTLYIAVVRSVL